MKTKCTTRWLTALAGVLLSVPLLGWAAKGGLPVELAACEAERDACLAEPCVVFPGDGYVGPELSYTNNGDGTFTDDNTGLMWEIKTGTLGGPVDCTVDPMPPVCFNVSDVKNCYDWTDAADGDNTNPDGLVFEFFLVMRNNTCGGETYEAYCESDADCGSAAIPYCGLAGHMDWRLPTVKELQSLVDYSESNPAAILPGATAGSYGSYHWSSTFPADQEFYASYVHFSYGDAGRASKLYDFHVRAVRGGL